MINAYLLSWPQLWQRFGGHANVEHVIFFSGVHLEGPFISQEKKGAHTAELVRSFAARGMKDVLDIYGDTDNVSIVTLAPELPRSHEVIRELNRRGICVSLGEEVSLTTSFPGRFAGNDT